MTALRFCEQVKAEERIGVECCWSCHDDFNEGYADLCEPDDHTLVCCAVAEAMPD